MDLLEVFITYLVITCLAFDSATSCGPSATTFRPPSGQETCDYDITPTTRADVLRITFTYHTYQPLVPIAFTEDDRCMCQEASEDGERFRVQLYRKRCPVGICPEIENADLTCNCTKYECRCFEYETGPSDEDDACVIPGMNLLPVFDASDSRTCYNIGEDGGSRKKRQAIISPIPTAPLVWTFCVCNLSQSIDQPENIQICECPSAVIATTTAFVPTTQDATTDARTTPVPTTESTTSVSTTTLTNRITTEPDEEQKTTTRAAATKPKNCDSSSSDDVDDDECSDDDVEFVESDILFKQSGFEIICKVPTTARLPSTSLSSTVKEDTVTKAPVPTGSDQRLRVLILLLAGMVAVIIIVIGVVLMCRRQRKSYDVKFQQARELDRPQTEGVDNEITVISSNDHSYGSLPDHPHPVRQLSEPAYTDPDVIPRRAPTSYEDIDLQNRNQDPVSYASINTQPTHTNPQQNVVPYASTPIQGRRQYENRDPVPYASADVQGRQHEGSEYATAYSHIPNNTTEGPSGQTRTGFPPYAKVNKPKHAKDQSSVDIVGNDGLGEVTDDQPHEYGKLNPPIRAADGSVKYHKLDRGLNKDIVDNAR